MLVEDFNAEDSETYLSNFLLEINAKNIVNNYTCHKSVENPSCIDFVIKNIPLSFQNTVTITTGLSDFYKMVITVLRTAFAKLIPKKVIYRDYKNFNRDKFKSKLEGKINENSNQIGAYDFFEKTILLASNKYAPIKVKTLGASHIPYMIKTLRKAIMKRTELETKYLKNKTGINLKAYKKQRNFCRKLYKKKRKKNHNKLNMNSIH